MTLDYVFHFCTVRLQTLPGRTGGGGRGGGNGFINIIERLLFFGHQSLGGRERERNKRKGKGLK